MTLFQIKSRFSSSVLFELECGSLRLAVEAAVERRADLRGAYLRLADLRGANLGGADLCGADLCGADLGGAYLRLADLRLADLGGADLGRADLRGANLGGAYLRGADLGGAYLRLADLRGHKVNGDFGIIEAGTPDHWSALGFVDADTGDLIVSVGCRVKTVSDGRAYWSGPEHPERESRREVLAALDYIEAVARLRGWTGAKSEAA